MFDESHFFLVRIGLLPCFLVPVETVVGSDSTLIVDGVWFDTLLCMEELVERKKGEYCVPSGGVFGILWWDAWNVVVMVDFSNVIRRIGPAQKLRKPNLDMVKHMRTVPVLVPGRLYQARVIMESLERELITLKFPFRSGVPCA